MSFEIIIFENQSLYNGTSEIQDEKEERTLTIGNLYVSYADNSGGDKPLNIILIGKLTEESKDYLKTELS